MVNASDDGYEMSARGREETFYALTTEELEDIGVKTALAMSTMA